ncbi:MAG TPA: recombinase family protein [Saprospiraceae bacterium]|nr:recombinase family protein [Saprospiraceae bacterium]
MEALIYSRVSSESQDNQRQIINLKTVAQEKGWNVRRVFQEKISGTIKSGSRTEFKSLIDYIDKTPVQVVMVSEISRIGRKVVDVLNFVEMLYEKGIALYIQQFNMLTMENGKENPVAKMLLQMLSIGAEMENSQRKIRQLEGIHLAKIKGVYNGRVNGAKSNPSLLMNKYQNILDLLDKSELSVRRIAGITGHSVNTVRKIRQLKEI